jgi:hypothetical protein
MSGPQGGGGSRRRPSAAMRAKSAIAHQRLREQADQFLAIDGIHLPTIQRERNRNNGGGQHQRGSWQPVPEASSRPHRRAPAGGPIRA